MKHTTKFDIFDPQEVWMGRPGPPDRSFNVAILNAELDVPVSGAGDIDMRVVVTTNGASRRTPSAPPGGATAAFFDSIRFGVSDGGHTGSDAAPTRVSAAHVEYSTTSELGATSVDFILYVYVKMVYQGRTLPFLEVKFHPQATGAGPGVAPVDRSPDPVVRFDPYGRLTASPRRP